MLVSFGQNGIQQSYEVSNSQWIHNDVSNGIIITYSFDLQQNTGTKLTTSLNISNGNTNVNYGNIELTNDNVLNAVDLGIILQSKYSSLITQYGKNTLLNNVNALNVMIGNIKDTLNDRKQHSFVYQALRMYQSISKGVLRDLSNTGIVNFTIFDGYINGLNSFECAEDIKFNIVDFKDYLNIRKLTDNNNIGIDYYLAALNNINENELSLTEINIKLKGYFETQSFPIRQYSRQEQGTAGKWPQGGQCGCCGNYSGNCYYWSNACLAHDMACQRCQWQACFGGCVPSSCSGNTIAWYWML